MTSTHAPYCVRSSHEDGPCTCLSHQQRAREAPEGDEMAKTSGKEAAANDDSPTPRQKGIPGVFENVKSIPALEEAMSVLADILDERNTVDRRLEKQKGVVESLLKKHKQPSYVIEKLMVSMKDPGEPTLYVKLLKAPKKKKDDDKTEAA